VEYDLTVSAELTNLPAIREFIQKMAREVCKDDHFSYDLTLAVDELVTNIIVHGYQGKSGKIVIHAQPEPPDLYIMIKDRARPFNPTLVESPDIHLPLEERRVGGLGIYMARTLTDDMTYRALPNGGNEIKVYKRCPESARLADD